jgi:hypothetical protein
MSLVFFTVWHSIVILRKMFKLLNSVHESLSGLEGRNLVGRDGDGDVLGDISSGFFSTRLDDETAKTSQINIVTFGHGGFHHFHEVLDYRLDSTFLDSSLTGDFGYDFCFGHFFAFFKGLLFWIVLNLPAKVRTFFIPPKRI